MFICLSRPQEIYSCPKTRLPFLLPFIPFRTLVATGCRLPKAPIGAVCTGRHLPQNGWSKTAARTKRCCFYIGRNGGFCRTFAGAGTSITPRRTPMSGRIPCCRRTRTALSRQLFFYYNIEWRGGVGFPVFAHRTPNAAFFTKAAKRAGMEPIPSLPIVCCACYL